MTFGSSSHYGRFVGAQFDLDQALQYQDEVLLVVRAKVSEKVLRQQATGATREISVLRAEDVFVADGVQADLLRSTFGIRGEDQVPELGHPLVLVSPTPVEAPNIESTHVVDPMSEITPAASTPVEEDRNSKRVDELPRRVRVGGRDKHLDKFLASVEP